MDFFTIWQHILVWANGGARRRRQGGQSEIEIHFPLTALLAGRCKLVASLHQRSKLLVVSLLLQLPVQSLRKCPLLIPLLA